MSICGKNFYRHLVAICLIVGVAGFSCAQSLFGAIQAGDLAQFNTVLRAEVDVNTADEYGQTPLMYAVSLGELDMVASLIVAGADVNAKTLAGWTALHYAARDSNVHAMVKLLIEAGADPSVRNQDGSTPFDLGLSVGGQGGDSPLGDRSESANTSLTSTSSPDAPSVIAVAVGGSNSLLLLEDRTVLAWGALEYGGGASASGWSTPELVQGLTNVQAISAGNGHSLALLSDGTVMAWGSNRRSQLGDGTTTSRDSPIRVEGLHGVRAIAAGDQTSFAVLQDGTVMAWGDNDHMQLGLNVSVQRRPQEVPGLANVEAISTSLRHSLALLRDGTVMSWGENANPIRDRLYEENPRKVHRVEGVTDATAVAAGSQYSIALLRDGTVMAWGPRYSRELGNDTITNRHEPVHVSGLDNVIAIEAKSTYSFAVLRDGTVMAWGNDRDGLLGDGSTTDTLSPVPIPSISNAIAVAAGYDHVYALLRDGSVMAWGSNRVGQIGLARDQYSARTPVPLTGLSEGVRLERATADAEAREAAWRAEIENDARVRAEEQQETAPFVRMANAAFQYAGVARIAGCPPVPIVIPLLQRADVAVCGTVLRSEIGTVRQALTLALLNEGMLPAIAWTTERAASGGTLHVARAEGHDWIVAPAIYVDDVAISTYVYLLFRKQ